MSVLLRLGRLLRSRRLGVPSPGYLNHITRCSSDGVAAIHWGPPTNCRPYAAAGWGVSRLLSTSQPLSAASLAGVGEKPKKTLNTTWGRVPEDVALRITAMENMLRAGNIKGVINTLAKCTPTVHEFNVAIKTCAILGNAEVGEQIFRLMSETDGVVPNSYSYGWLINALSKAKKVKEAEQVLAEMIEHGLQPNVGIYNAILGGYSSIQNNISALEFFNWMKSSGVQPDSHSYAIVIRSTRHGRLNPASAEDKMATIDHLFQELRESGQRVLPRAHLEYILSSLRFNGVAQGVKAWYRMMEDTTRGAENQKGIDHNHVYALNAVITACGKSGDLLTALEVYEQSQKYGVIPDADTASSLLGITRSSHFHSKEQQEAVSQELLELVASMQERMGILGKGRHGEKGPRMDLGGYNRLISNYSSAGMMFKANKLVTQLMREGIRPSNATFTAIVSGYGKKGEHTKALQTIIRMRSLGLKPSSKTLGSFLVAITQGARKLEYIEKSALDKDTGALRKRLNESLKEAERMLISGEIAVDLDVCHSFVKALSYCNMGNRALDFVKKDMPDMGHLPTTQTYNYLLHGFQVELVDEMKDVVDGMMKAKVGEESGFPPADIVTINTYIGYCRRVGFHDLAMDAFKDAKMTRGMKPDHITYNSILHMCSLHGEWRQALDILEDMKQNSIHFSVRTYNHVIMACCGSSWDAIGPVMESLLDDMFQTAVPNGATYALVSNVISAAGENPTEMMPKLMKRFEGSHSIADVQNGSTS